ncbi:hypothetical protein [Oryzomonas rubra]|uniref:Uncharacterized protein n=1 Tax=Oryzomonas rubra TaxID=2509454 RepID=A0A5A9XMT4_9BACT|nr:hypothetical protein [Oryzomonas rubra]KAA0894160.1 hypothetical protein ET418_04170 [Oryzomonas rubra]
MVVSRYALVTKFIGVFLVVIALNGCYSFSNMTKTPDFSDNIAVASKNNKSDKLGYISSINVKTNNSITNTSDGFVNRVVGKLKQSNYFEDLGYGLYSKKPNAPYYDLNISIEENPDMNMGMNITKGFLTGLTLFVLAPVLTNTYDFSTNHSLEVTWPDGAKREYKATCSGSASGTFPYSGLVKEYHKIVSDATERCLTSVINQFTADR